MGPVYSLPTSYVVTHSEEVPGSITRAHSCTTTVVTRFLQNVLLKPSCSCDMQAEGGRKKDKAHTQSSWYREKTNLTVLRFS